MIPMYLEFQAFGPYPKKEKIDFAGLEDHVVHIYGAGGAGKTTILNALTCALYGRPVSGKGKSPGDMRCQYADDADATYASFVFSASRQIYRFDYLVHHQRKSDGRYSYTCEQLSFLQNASGEWDALRLDPNEANWECMAEKVLGLSYDRFCSTVILPGTQIFRLFNAEEETPSFCSFDAQSNRVQYRLAENTKFLEHVRKTLQGLEAEFLHATELNEKFCRLLNARERLDGLESRNDEINQFREYLRDRQLFEAYHAWDAACGAVVQRRREHSELNYSISAVDLKIADYEKSIEMLDAKIANLEKKVISEIELRELCSSYHNNLDKEYELVSIMGMREALKCEADKIAFEYQAAQGLYEKLYRDYCKQLKLMSPQPNKSSRTRKKGAETDLPAAGKNRTRDLISQSDLDALGKKANDLNQILQEKYEEIDILEIAITRKQKAFQKECKCTQEEYAIAQARLRELNDAQKGLKVSQKRKKEYTNGLSELRKKREEMIERKDQNALLLETCTENERNLKARLLEIAPNLSDRALRNIPYFTAADYNRFAEEISKHDILMAETADCVTKLHEQLQGQKRPDIAGLQERVRVVRQVFEQLKVENDLLRREYDQGNENDGKLPYGIVQKTNAFLENAFDGRYHICLETGERIEKIKVFDQWSEKQRSFSTFSDAEKALFALALSAAVSALTEPANRADRFGIVFLDESFCRFDRGLRKKAVQMLSSVPGTECVFEFTSDAPSFSDTAPSGIHIQTNSRGSTLRIIHGKR